MEYNPETEVIIDDMNDDSKIYSMINDDFDEPFLSGDGTINKSINVFNNISDGLIAV